MKWEISTEAVDGPAFDLRTGKSVDGRGTRVKYRRAGSRNRWLSFVVVGEVPQDLQAVVTAYVEAL